MTYKVKTAAAAIIWGMICVMAALSISGCDGSRTGTTKVSDAGTVGADQRKVQLLKEIDRRYENPDAHYELGKLYLADGLYDKAEWHFNVSIAFNPIHRRSQAAIVRTLISAGDQAKSKLAAEIYINQASSTAEGSLLLGQAFQKELLDDYALMCYQQALGLAPNSAAINKQIGYYYLSKNDKVRAEEYLRRSFQLDPYQPEVAGELGRLGIVIQIPRKTEDGQKIDKKVEK